MAVKGMEGPFLNLFSRKITVDLLTCLYVQLYFRYLIIYISISDQNAIYNRLMYCMPLLSMSTINKAGHYIRNIL